MRSVSAPIRLGRCKLARRDVSALWSNGGPSLNMEWVRNATTPTARGPVRPMAPADVAKPRRHVSEMSATSRSALVSVAFVVSGLTSYITLAASKRLLTPDEFGTFALFWSTGFFAAAVCASPNEQELSRSLAVQQERNRSGRNDVVTATRSTVFATVIVVAICVLSFVSGLFGDSIAAGVVGALVVLVVGESVTAMVRGEMAARRDTAGLVIVVGLQGIVRATAALVLGLATGNLVAVCFAVTIGVLVPLGFVPRLMGRIDDVPEPSSPPHDGLVAGSEFSRRGVRKLAVATPPRALFAIGTPLLAAAVAGDDETALVGDVLAALSLTSAPVLVAAAIQVVLLPQFASLAEQGRGDQIRTRTHTIIGLVFAGTVLASALAASIGVELLEILFGDSPGIDGTDLAAMTFGAGMLFLANLLMPVSVAARSYSNVTVAWVGGALVLAVSSLLPGDTAFAIGRAVLLGAVVVNLILLWGLRSLLIPRRWAGGGPMRTSNAGSEG
jgi:O-antigen/teichoic acid export membrane protein